VEEILPVHEGHGPLQGRLSSHEHAAQRITPPEASRHVERGANVTIIMNHYSIFVKALWPRRDNHAVPWNGPADRAHDNARLSTHRESLGLAWSGDRPSVAAQVTHE